MDVDEPAVAIRAKAGVWLAIVHPVIHSFVNELCAHHCNSIHYISVKDVVILYLQVESGGTIAGL